MPRICNRDPGCFDSKGLIGQKFPIVVSLELEIGIGGQWRGRREIGNITGDKGPL